ncbi:acyl-CoA synthetase [Haloarchaeobius sp. HRN-SO-5]|uniref:acyl-CoA synthetase n=1 Tax=Haloarchaeobius sp. HRN-SO-5 TaxID=3446118 RepID=UPI003EC05176
MPTQHNTFGSVVVDWDEEPVPNMGQFETYQEAREAMEWDVPETFNIATDVVTKHADDRGRVAMFQEIEGGDERTHTFWRLDRRSNEIASALESRGVGRGDRVAIIGSRSDQVMLSHLATWKLGGISVPLSVLYGPDALEFRLSDSEPTAVFVDPELLDAVGETIASIENVDCVVGMGAEPDVDGVETLAFEALDGDRTYDAAETAPDDPAFILYTSGTTGQPKGVLQTHQALVGWLPSFQMCFELPWHEADPFLYATPDLAWIGGINLVLGSWHYGFPVLRYDSTSGFDPATIFENVEKYGTTRAVMVPAMLKPMSKLDASQYDLSTLTVVMSGSEPVSETLYEYVTETLDANLNEMYGQTEAMHLITTCERWFDVEPGSLGYPAPGHEIDVIDEDGNRLDDGETGIIGLEKPDPVMFRELWNDPVGTEDKFVGDWMNTDDLGQKDENGQFWFKSRADNLILTSGYRVGPAEVEDSIIELDAVANVGVIGVPDERRGELVKAYVEVADGFEESQTLESQIQDHVRQNLAKYEYPREIEFIEEMPTTVTGKIRRHELEEREGLE